MAEQELLQQIAAKVSQTWRRQLGQLILGFLPTALAASVLCAVVWMLLKPWLPVDAPIWLPLGAAGGVALLATAVWARLHLPSRVNAALSLDRAFDLKERMTTAVSLDPSLRATAAGQALLDDARQRLDQIKVAERFPLQVRPRPWLAPLGAVLAFTLACFFALSPQPQIAQADKPKDEPLVQKLDPLALQALKQANEERRERLKELDTEKLKELQAEFDKLIAQLDKLDKPADAQLALQDVTKLTEQVQKRQEELSKTFDLKRKLKADAGLKEQKDGPTKDLQKALADGDLKKATEEMQKLLDQMKNKQLSDEQKEKLAKDLKELQEKLKDIASNKKKLEALEKSNADPETKQREMQKLLQECANMKDLAEMADMMQQAQQALEKGDQKAAMDKLKELAEQLKELEIDNRLISELQLAEADLEEIKEGLG
jgi:hypothetical protein